MWMSHNIDRWFTIWMGGGGVYFRMENVKEDWFINIIIHTKSQNKLLLQVEISDHLIMDEIIVPK